jgi:hypothetical protein
MIRVCNLGVVSIWRLRRMPLATSGSASFPYCLEKSYSTIHTISLSVDESVRIVIPHVARKFPTWKGISVLHPNQGINYLLLWAPLTQHNIKCRYTRE